MKKRIGILFAMAILMGIPFAVNASETSGSDDKAIKSYGSIIYENGYGESVKIYAEDIALLQEKLASVPDEIFDPAIYVQTKALTRAWEYRDMTDQDHMISYETDLDITGGEWDYMMNPKTEILEELEEIEEEPEITDQMEAPEMSVSGNDIEGEAPERSVSENDIGEDIEKEGEENQ